VIGIVLAAGLGTRLRPYSEAISKAAMPVAGVPIVLRVIEQLRAAGVEGRFIVIARSPRHDIVPLIVEHARRSGYEVSFGYQDEQRGSAHALMQVPGSQRLDDDVLIGACDNLYEPDELKRLVAQHAERGPDGTLAVLRVPPEKMTASSNVVVDGERVTHVVEKPRVNQIASPFAGPCLYAFSPKIFGYLGAVAESPRGELEFQDAMQAFIGDGARVEWFELSRRVTLTTPDELLALNEAFFADMPAGIHPISGSTIVEPCVLGPGVQIGEGSTIGPNAHLMRGCRVGRDCTVRHALVFPGAAVADGTTVEHTLVAPAS
jgi:NDP-sugar pyrophosphorylase family protein